MRYIDADKLIQQIEADSKGNEGQYGDDWKFMDTIRSQPTADVRENVSGEWIKKKGSLWTLATCSVCGELSVEGDKPFCPNCGADMRGDKGNAERI